MVLTSENETIRASILHRQSLLSLESVVSEFLSEEICRSILKSQPIHSNVDKNDVLATASNSPKILEDM